MIIEDEFGEDENLEADQILDEEIFVKNEGVEALAVEELMEDDVSKLSAPSPTPSHGRWRRFRRFGKSVKKTLQRLFCSCVVRPETDFL